MNSRDAGLWMTLAPKALAAKFPHTTRFFMTIGPSLLLWASMLCATAFAALGQGASGGPEFGTDPVIKSLFKEFKAFTALVQIDMEQMGQTLSVELRVEELNGSTRTDLDMLKLRSPGIPPGSIERMVALGFSPMISLTSEDSKKVHVLYPALKAYASMPLPAAMADKGKAQFKTSASDLGREKVAGHDCTKKKLLITTAPGKAREIIAWIAHDLKGFPVKLQYTENGNPVTVTFIKVSFAPPAAKDFELPSGYTAYADVPTLMQSEMSKSMETTQ